MKYDSGVFDFHSLCVQLVDGGKKKKMYQQSTSDTFTRKIQI